MFVAGLGTSLHMREVADVSVGRAEESTWLDRAIRFGLVAYGLVYLLIAWLAAQLALGDYEGKASSTGALAQVAEQSFGTVLLWAIAVGMFVLVLWRLIQTVRGEDDDDGASEWLKRAGHLVKAVIYGWVGFSAVQFAVGSGSAGGGTDATTAKLMRLPAGPWIVGAVGAAVIAYGAVQVWRAWTEKFREYLTSEGKSGDAGTLYIAFGKAGYTAKGIAFALVGSLFAYAALTHDPDKSGGLDQALREVLDAPAGPVLLGLIALGLACYGLFCFARARHLSR